VWTMWCNLLCGGRFDLTPGGCGRQTCVISIAQNLQQNVKSYT